MLKRTPPQTPASGSLPNITATLTEAHSYHTSPAGSSCDNITQRAIKRPRDDSQDLKDLFADMFRSWKLDQDIKHNIMLSTLEEIKSQNADIRCSMEFMSSKFEDMTQRISLLEMERKKDQEYIQSLENKLDTLERNQKLASIEIRGVPQSEGETKTQLVDLVRSAGKSLNVPLNSADIRDVYRTKSKPGANKHIVVDLNSVVVKNDVINAVKSFNKDKSKSKFSTTSLGLVGTSKPVYISEYLSPKTKRLYHLARAFAASNKFAYCWTSYGRVYMRQRERGPLIRIDTEEDLNKIHIDP